MTPYERGADCPSRSPQSASHPNAGMNATQLVAESQAPAPSEPGDRGVAPTLADPRPARPGPDVVMLSQREKGLIWGAALVALHGLESELQSLCFARGYETDSDLEEVRRVRKAYENREQVETKHRWILDRMAHTAQTIRVSRDEWESVVPIRSSRKEEQELKAMLSERSK